MKSIITFFKLAALPCLIVATINTAVAGPYTTLQVKGSVAPGACVPSLSQGGIIDLGETTVQEITGTSLAKSGNDVSLTIECKTATKVRMSFTDNRNDTAVTGIVGNSQYSILGLGKTAEGINIGAYVLKVSQAVINGASGDVILSGNGTSNWHTSTEEIWVTNRSTPDWVSVSKPGLKQPAAFTTMTLNLGIKASISGDTKTIKDIANIDGNATLNLEYM